MGKIPFSAYDFFGYLASGLLVLVGVDQALQAGWTTRSLSPIEIGVVLVAIYTAGHAVAHLSSVTLEHGLVRGVLGPPEQHLLADEPAGLMRFLFPGHYKALPQESRGRVQAAREICGGPQDSRAFFFHCFSLVKRESDVNERLSTFLNLYGFARNMCFALLAGSMLLGAAAVLSEEPSSGRVLAGWAALAGLGAIVMFYRYLKFFRHYTVEVFLSYAELSPEDQERQE